MAVTKTPRMGKGSKARKAANRRLPAVLHAFNEVRDKLLKREKHHAKPSRQLQRKWRLAALAAKKKAMAEKRDALTKMLGVFSKPKAEKVA